MTNEENVYVIDPGLPMRPDASETIYIVNLNPDPPKAQKTVVITNNPLESGISTGIKTVKVVNDGLPHPLGGERADFQVHAKNLENLPLTIRVAHGIQCCPRCSRTLTIFGNYQFGCDRCELEWEGWMLERIWGLRNP